MIPDLTLFLENNLTRSPRSKTAMKTHTITKNHETIVTIGKQTIAQIRCQPTDETACHYI
jgi:hypothetical protein